MEIARQYDCGPTDRLRRIAELDIPKEEAEAARKTIKRSSARAKYDSYFDVAPIYAAAVELLEQRPLQEAVLRQAVVVLLRLTTLMRAGDLERTLPRIFHDNGIDFIHAVAKGGVCRSFAITGNTLRATKMYIDRIKKPPRAPIPCALICYLKTGDPLGSEAISKTALHLMEKCGVDTEVFKAHALRGASATAMLARGVDKVAVQAKGGWATEESFIHNYARLHNRIDFDELFVRAAREWLPGEPQPDPGAIGLLPDGNLCGRRRKT